MTDKPKIDFVRVSLLLDVVQKLSTVAPSKTALTGLAMEEIHQNQLDAMEYLRIVGEERIAKEQEAATRLNAKRQAEREAEVKANEAALRPKVTPKPAFTVTPGEPVDPAIVQETDDPGSISDAPIYPADSGVSETLIDRRV